MPRSDTARPAALSGAALALAAAAALPIVADPYLLRVATAVLLTGTFAQSINLIAGFTGYAAFGQVIFFGLGAYANAIMMLRFGAGLALGMLVAMALAVVLALIVGWPLLRLRGHYFAIATLGLNEAVRAVVTNLTALTGGGQGLSLPLPAGGVAANARFFYWSFLVLATVTTAFLWSLSVSRFGYGCRAIRADESAAEGLGVPTTRFKLTAWALSAMPAAAAGALFGYWFSYIEPGSVFDMNLSVKGFVVLLLGGSGSVFGPLAAAFLIEILATFLWSKFLTFHLGALGALIILIVLSAPGGFAEIASHRVSLPAIARRFRREPY